MRRRYSGRTDAMVGGHEGEQGFWPSYADMMSAVALILFFLMLLSYISNMITGNNLKNTESQLSETRTELAEKEKELLSLEDSLALTMQQVFPDDPSAVKYGEGMAKKAAGLITEYRSYAVELYPDADFGKGDDE